MIVFVASNQYEKSTLNGAAFVGTKEYLTLLTWIYKLDIDVSDVFTCNATDPWAPDMIYAAVKVIALGDKAEQVVLRNRDDYFKLPDPEDFYDNDLYVARKIKDCKNYVHRNHPKYDQKLYE